jgi:hypothetical protein
LLQSPFHLSSISIFPSISLQSPHLPITSPQIINHRPLIEISLQSLPPSPSPPFTFTHLLLSLSSPFRQQSHEINGASIIALFSENEAWTAIKFIVVRSSHNENCLVPLLFQWEAYIVDFGLIAEQKKKTQLTKKRNFLLDFHDFFGLRLFSVNVYIINH